jgi:hypothetical protein
MITTLPVTVLSTAIVSATVSRDGLDVQGDAIVLLPILIPLDLLDDVRVEHLLTPAGHDPGECPLHAPRL